MFKAPLFSILDKIMGKNSCLSREVRLSSYFYADIAASYVPVYANQTWSFLHMILSTGPQSLVNLRTSNIYCVLSIYVLSILCILISVSFHVEIEHLCNAESFGAIFSHWTLETSLLSPLL